MTKTADSKFPFVANHADRLIDMLQQYYSESDIDSPLDFCFALMLVLDSAIHAISHMEVKHAMRDTAVRILRDTEENGLSR